MVFQFWLIQSYISTYGIPVLVDPVLYFSFDSSEVASLQIWVNDD